MPYALNKKTTTVENNRHSEQQQWFAVRFKHNGSAITITPINSITTITAITTTTKCYTPNVIKKNI